MLFPKTNKTKYFLICYIIFCSTITNAQIKENISYVDPFIGTGGDHGQLSPAATIPFGMVKLGPDTYPINHSGYDYYATKIAGFTINRVEGAGCTGAGGNLLIQPGIGQPEMKLLEYNKTSEQAKPGYYTVTFDEPKIKAELTATNGTGLQRFTFPESKRAFLGINFEASYATFINEEHYKNSDFEMTGWVHAKNVCDYGAYKIYFSILSNKRFAYVEDTKNRHIAFLKFNTINNEQILLKISISTISIEDAKRDRFEQVGDMGFEQVKANALHTWKGRLSNVNVTGNDTLKTLFYTHLYHSYLSPVTITGSNGNYRGVDGEIQKASTASHYHSWAVWDNFRTTLPLISITQPKIFGDIAASLSSIYKQGKYGWAGSMEPSPTARTERSSVVLLDAWNKGFRNFNFKQIYSDLCNEASAFTYNSPDDQLESSYDNWAMARIASIIGNKTDSKKYSAKAVMYKQTWLSTFAKPDSASWDIVHGAGMYEGTIWQYRWFVPHDIAGIISLVNGKENFEKQLDYFFDKNLYNHANEPDIQVPFLYNFLGASWKTQKIVNKIMLNNFTQRYATHKLFKIPIEGKLYSTSPKGFVEEMDDDAGTMSSWYVLASMGIYPALVGEPIYSLTSPTFQKVEIELPNRKTFLIACRNYKLNSNIYINKATLNGKALQRNWLTYQEIMQGGKLVLDMSAIPNKSWGTGERYVPAMKWPEYFSGK